MGQKEVLDVIEKKREWLTTSEISKLLPGLSVSGINESLSRLVKGGFVETKKCNHLKHAYYYRVK